MTNVQKIETQVTIGDSGTLTVKNVGICTVIITWQKNPLHGVKLYVCNTGNLHKTI